MNIKGIEIDFNFLDADDIEECEKRKRTELSMSQIIRFECEIIDNFFNEVFGDGIAEKIFKGKKNLEEHIKAFEDIVAEKEKQRISIQDIYNKYQPNREQRRNNQYHKNKNNGKYSNR